MTTEQLFCNSCKQPIKLDDDNTAHFARIQRGYFKIDTDENFIMEDESNIKCELWLCPKCYLEDADLCRFFNKIGYTMR